MRNIPLAIRRAAHSYDQPSAWLVLFTLDLGGGNIVRVVNNTEDIVYQGETYFAWAIKFGEVTEQNTGEIPVVKLSVGNTGGILSAYVDEYEGAVGRSCSIVVVNADKLSEDYSELTITLSIQSSVNDGASINFNLSVPNPLRSRFPRYRYFANHCRYVSDFKGMYCQYSGTDSTCDGTLESCIAKGNIVRFGGFFGLSGSIKVVK